jgi:hypothetical protein
MVNIAEHGGIDKNKSRGYRFFYKKCCSNEKENAKRVFEQSLEDMSKIDTKRLESIKNLKDNKIKFEGICNGLIEPITN